MSNGNLLTRRPQRNFMLPLPTQARVPGILPAQARAPGAPAPGQFPGSPLQMRGGRAAAPAYGPALRELSGRGASQYGPRAALAAPVGVPAPASGASMTAQQMLAMLLQQQLGPAAGQGPTVPPQPASVPTVRPQPAPGARPGGQGAALAQLLMALPTGAPPPTGGPPPRRF